ncbi:MAG: hypothetical protein CVV13_10495 [Gammaproteobacteria bacterium HGW-Gammaproteobacteria-3]|nr:MAG: hypothetical protein CVV13_10495 [Gammaproteobacteria bacterium HGW-Gammaproteobacteria-3]
MTLIADRVKHAALLVTTAWLPKALRVPVRFRLFSMFQLAKARRADILIIGHPKTGGTWLRVMLARLYHLKYGMPMRRIFKTDELHRYQSDLPRYLNTNGHYSYEGVIKTAEKASVFQGKKLVLIARHPCDVAVSWFLQYTKRTKAFKRELIERDIKQPIDREQISMWEFVMHPEYGLPALIDFFNGWEKELENHEEKLILRYEDLRAHPFDTLKRLTEFLGEQFTDAQIEDAVTYGSMDNMRKLESSNYFANASLRLRNPDDPDAFKVRRGKVKGYRDYFSPEQVALMEASVQSRLSPTFGYQDNQSAPFVIPEQQNNSNSFTDRANA